jgi:hypothetical protein
MLEVWFCPYSGMGQSPRAEKFTLRRYPTSLVKFSSFSHIASHILNLELFGFFITRALDTLNSNLGSP